MSSEEAFRAGNPDDDRRNNCCSYVASIDSALARDLSDQDSRRRAFLSFVQVTQCTLVLKMNPKWKTEEILSHITAKVGMSFETLGARWLMAYGGATTGGGVSTFHFDIGAGTKSGFDLLPPALRAELACKGWSLIVVVNLTGKMESKLIHPS